MYYLPGSVQWMGCYLFACQLPSKELSALHLLFFTICNCVFVMQFVYCMQFPTICMKCIKMKNTSVILSQSHLLPLLQPFPPKVCQVPMT